MTWLLPLCALTCLMTQADGHGRMLMPMSRASAWRFGVPGAPVDYDDNQNFCGGVAVQSKFNGSCGICGDPYNQTEPRDHERPNGTYVMATNYILSTYVPAQVNYTLDVTIEITAHHKGFFEFQLCNVDPIVNGRDPYLVEATKDCFGPPLLIISVSVDGYKSSVNKYRYNKLDPPKYLDKKFYLISLQMPSYLCDHCVLRWRYETGNSPDLEYPEQFYSCADIRIVSNDATLPPPTPTPSPTPTTVDYIPEEVKNYSVPLTAYEKKFYLCNFCFNQWLSVPNKDFYPEVCGDYPDNPRLCGR